MCFSFNVVVRIPLVSLVIALARSLAVHSHIPSPRSIDCSVDRHLCEMCVYMLRNDEGKTLCVHLTSSLSPSASSLPPVARRCYYLGHEKKTHRTPTQRHERVFHHPPLRLSSSFSLRRRCAFVCVGAAMPLITTQSKNRKTFRLFTK